MITKTKLALVAAFALVGVASPALAEGFPVIPQYSLPNDASGYAVAPSRHTRQVVHGRTLYNSTAVPNGDWSDDGTWSTTGRQNSGR